MFGFDSISGSASIPTYVVSRLTATNIILSIRTQSFIAAEVDEVLDFSSVKTGRRKASARSIQVHGDALAFRLRSFQRVLEPCYPVRNREVSIWTDGLRDSAQLIYVQALSDRLLENSGLFSG